MPVYVDSARVTRRRGKRYDQWSNLTSDDQDHLHAFAQKLGLRRGWALDAGDGRLYYEVTEANRIKALELGAIAVGAQPDQPALPLDLPAQAPAQRPAVPDYAALRSAAAVPHLLDYTAIDVETANGKRGSICQLGMVRVRGGQPAERWQTLLRPHATFGDFNWMNTKVHKITAKTVTTAPVFAEVVSDITDFIGSDILVAHNAAFEKSALTQAAQAAGVAVPGTQIICTVEIARRALPGLERYRLPTVLEALGHQATNHHDALADALDAAVILNGCAQVLGAQDLAEIVRATGVGFKPLG